MSRDPATHLAETARLLGAAPYPEGRAWRCLKCGFRCDDSGPDCCPHDDGPLVRTMLSFSLGPR